MSIEKQEVHHLAIQVAAFVLYQLRADETCDLIIEGQFDNVLFKVFQFADADQVSVETRGHVRRLQQLRRQAQLFAQPGVLLQAVLLVVAEENNQIWQRHTPADLLLSRVERPSWSDLGDELLVAFVRLLLQRDLRDALLVVVVVEDQRHVLKFSVRTVQIPLQDLLGA